MNLSEQSIETLQKLQEAISLLEEATLSKKSQAWYNKVMDPGKEAAQGKIQLKVYTPDEAMSVARGMDKAAQDKKDFIKSLPKPKKTKETAPAPKQLGLFCSLEEAILLMEDIISFL